MTDLTRGDPLGELRRRPIAPTEKGFGPLAARLPLSAAHVQQARPSLFEGGFSFPLLVLLENALTHNIAAMAQYCREVGIQIAPHGKTMMAPQLAALQLQAGAWGITVATIGQLQTYREFGVRRLLLANELVDPAGIDWLAGQLAGDEALQVHCYVDSVQGVLLLDKRLDAGSVGRRLPVLVELGFAGGRTGARTHEQALEVARAAAATSTLRVAGVAAYEGGLGRSADAQTLEAVHTYGERVRGTADLLMDNGIAEGEQVISAGGSAYFDAVVDALIAPGAPAAPASRDRPTVLIRSGAYLTHDHGFYQANSPAARHTAGSVTLRPAIEVWAPVLSRPEPELVLICAGRRDVPVDMGMPVPLRVRRRDGRAADASAWQVTAVNDQHGYLRVPPEAEISPGDLVCLGISHPCTAFDKWRVIPVVDEAYRVVDLVHTFF